MMRGSDQLNYRIIFKLKKGKTKQDTIIEIGQAKAASIRGRIHKLKKKGEPIPDLIELSKCSRTELRNGNLK